MDLKSVTQWYDFKGRTAVITGGAGILGGELACALVGCGANVAMF
jgi:NAD(P)-dependent dehydrogenase (short-subunit alcohol dehydrogenase family)